MSLLSMGLLAPLLITYRNDFPNENQPRQVSFLLINIFIRRSSFILVEYFYGGERSVFRTTLLGRYRRSRWYKIELHSKSSALSSNTYRPNELRFRTLFFFSSRELILLYLIRYSISGCSSLSVTWCYSKWNLHIVTYIGLRCTSSSPYLWCWLKIFERYNKINDSTRKRKAFWIVCHGIHNTNVRTMAPVWYVDDICICTTVRFILHRHRIEICFKNPTRLIYTCKVFANILFNNFSRFRIVLAIDLELWFLFSLRFVSAVKLLGPKLFMIRNMVRTCYTNGCHNS